MENYQSLDSQWDFEFSLHSILQNNTDQKLSTLLDHKL